MRKHKFNLPPVVYVKLRNLTIELIIVSIIIFFGGRLIIKRARNALGDSDYFKIKDIIVSKTEEGLDFSYFRGRNIFNLDLEKESRYISELYPDYKKVRLVRILPNRLFVGFTERRPLAYVKLYRYFFADSDLVLFNVPRGQEETDLPVIVGLETKIFGAKSGKRYNIKELAEALNIIKELNSNNALKKYKIKRVDVANPANASFFLQRPDYPKGLTTAVPEALEVKMGQDDTSDKIHILGDIFNQLKNDLGDIKYIDLRFKEPVIKFKDAK